MDEVKSILNSLFKWTVSNRLCLNSMKTSAVLFTNRSGAVETPLLLKVFDDPVYYENSVKFLGLILDC